MNDELPSVWTSLKRIFRNWVRGYSQADVESLEWKISKTDSSGEEFPMTRREQNALNAGAVDLKGRIVSWWEAQ